MNGLASMSREFEKATERFVLLDHAPIGQLVLRRDYVVLFWNKCLEAWTGIDRSRIVGTDIREFFPHLGAAKYVDRITGIFAGGPPTIFSSQLHRYVIPALLPGAKHRSQYTVVTSIPSECKEACYALFAIQDVTSLTEAIENHRAALKRAMEEMEERKRAQAELETFSEELKRLNRALEERSIRDGLTGLYNHRHFYEVLNRDFQLALRNDTDLACILLDLDHFKEVNDTHGHPCGDAVLREVAAVIRRKVRKTDVVARYGGEEFAVILPLCHQSTALEVADRIREAVEEADLETESDGQPRHITVSVGICTGPENAADHEELVRRADDAMYASKRDGRNKCTVWEPSLSGAKEAASG